MVAPTDSPADWRVLYRHDQHRKQANKAKCRLLPTNCPCLSRPAGGGPLPRWHPADRVKRDAIATGGDLSFQPAFPGTAGRRPHLCAIAGWRSRTHAPVGGHSSAVSPSLARTRTSRKSCPCGAACSPSHRPHCLLDTVASPESSKFFIFLLRYMNTSMLRW